METGFDARWVGEVDATLREHWKLIGDLREDVDSISDDLVDVRLDVRGLVVRVSLHAAIAAAVGAAIVTPLLYLLLAHWIGAPVHTGKP
jgi:hypothetical protein